MIANRSVDLKRALALLLAAVTIIVMTACSKEEKDDPAPSPAPAPAASSDKQALDDPKEPAQSVQAATDEPAPSSEDEPGNDVLSLEQISAKDAEQYLEVLKKEDAEQMSALLVHAENENTPETMRLVIAGFKLHFDQLADLKLVFESNQQDEEFYIENYRITGVKDGEERFVPLKVKYYKQDGLEKIRDDARREPLFDSPMINQYPYMIDDVKRYLRAMIEEDKESLMLHLGFYDATEENASAVDRLLKKYKKEMDLKTTSVVPLGYNENEELFRFELQDEQGHVHRIQTEGKTWFIQDDWTKSS